MTSRKKAGQLQVDMLLYDFIENEVLPGSGVASTAFWAGFDAIVHDLAPENKALLAERDRLQAEMDAWHRANPGPIQDMGAYKAFLKRIGYLQDEPDQIRVNTQNIDTEFSHQAGQRGQPGTTRSGVTR